MRNKPVKLRNEETKKELIFPTPYSAERFLKENGFEVCNIKDWFVGMEVYNNNCNCFTIWYW